MRAFVVCTSNDMPNFLSEKEDPALKNHYFAWRRRFIPFNFVLSLAAPHLHGVLVLVIGNKFIAGVVVTGDNCSPVPLSPATKLSPVSLLPNHVEVIILLICPFLVCFLMFYMASGCLQF